MPGFLWRLIIVETFSCGIVFLVGRNFLADHNIFWLFRDSLSENCGLRENGRGWNRGWFNSVTGIRVLGIEGLLRRSKWWFSLDFSDDELRVYEGYHK